MNGEYNIRIVRSLLSQFSLPKLPPNGRCISSQIAATSIVFLFIKKKPFFLFEIWVTCLDPTESKIPKSDSSSSLICLSQIKTFGCLYLFITHFRKKKKTLDPKLKSASEFLLRNFHSPKPKSQKLAILEGYLKSESAKTFTSNKPNRYPSSRLLKLICLSLNILSSRTCLSLNVLSSWTWCPSSQYLKVNWTRDIIKVGILLKFLET